MSHSIRLKTYEKVEYFLRSGIAFFGLFFFSFGLLFLVVFSPNTDFESVYYSLYQVEKASGTVLGSKPTNSFFNEQPIRTYQYKFKVKDGSTVTAESFAPSQAYRLGNRVQVEYLPDHHDLSRIESTANAPFGIGSFFFLLMFPGIGLSILVARFNKTRQELHVLTDFVWIEGTRESIRVEKDSENDDFYVLTFAFSHNGRQYKHNFQTAHKKHIKQEMVLIFPPKRPYKAVFVQGLPQPIRDRVYEFYRTNRP